MTVVFRPIFLVNPLSKCQTTVTQEEMVEVSTVKDLVNLIQAKSGK